MEKQTQVIDASVIIKWFVNEFDTEKALQIREDFISEKTNIIIPELAFTEILNALRYKNNNEEDLIKINRALWDLNLKIEKNSQNLLNKAITNAKKYNITIYDSIYVSTAQLHNSPLITADEELFKIPNILPLNKT
jgi:predicted nucleic acid-binding protein